MKIIVTGSNGFVGSALVVQLVKDGHSVTRLVRDKSATGADRVYWNPQSDEIDAARLENHDAAIHLAGENAGTARWTEAKKRRIRDSRVKGTRLVSEAFAGLSSPPRVFVCASATGYYGNRDDEILTEASAPGDDFLAGVCRDWEAAADAARASGIRTVHLRLGLILGGKGGPLPRMIQPFKFGIGGRFGSGEQYMSWITIDDTIGVILFVLENAQLEGAINTVTPNPVKNREFTGTLGKVINRPSAIPLPATVARLVFGEVADALVLVSQRAMPEKLIKAGFSFKFPELEPALRHVLKED
jgi:uncharacterized protein